MIHTLRSIAICVCFLSLAACAKPNVGSGFSLDAAGSEGYGLLVGSLTTDSPGTSLSIRTEFDFVPYQSVSHDGGNIDVRSDCSKDDQASSDFGDVCGHLFAIKLPAQDYVLTGFIIHSGIQETYLPVHWDPVHFTVTAGKATYIGSIHMRLGVGGGILGQQGDGGWPSVADQRERDIGLLLQRYPQFKPDDILYKLVTLPPDQGTCRLVTVGSSSYCN